MRKVLIIVFILVVVAIIIGNLSRTIYDIAKSRRIQ